MEASVVVVGDEILSGHVHDANSHFIAERLAELGHSLRRIDVVGDDPAEIESAIAREMSDERIGIIFICGGLGPTHDDRTMEGVAAALSLPLEPCTSIARRIEEISGKIREAQFAGDPLGLDGLGKMALAPAGAEALECSIGVIPAVTLLARGVRFVILPGPPRELAIVFRECVEPRFLEGTGAPVWREEVEHLFPESALAVMLAGAESEFPDVKIGSYPLADRVLIRIAGPKDQAREAAERVRVAIKELEQSDDGRRLLEFMRSRRS